MGQDGSERESSLPQSLLFELRQHLLVLRQRNRADLAAGWGQVLMP
jgi:hypothetical protein